MGRCLPFAEEVVEGGVVAGDVEVAGADVVGVVLGEGGDVADVDEVLVVLVLGENAVGGKSEQEEKCEEGGQLSDHRGVLIIY